MGKLTDRQIQAFTYPRDRGRHSDGMGLFLDVRNGIKVWIRRYRWKKPSGEWSEKVITIGHYPQAGWRAQYPVGLAEARQKNAEIRGLAEAQITPALFFRRLWERTEDWHGKNHN